MPFVIKYGPENLEEEAKKLAEDPVVQIKKREIEVKEREQELQRVEVAR